MYLDWETHTQLTEMAIPSQKHLNSTFHSLVDRSNMFYLLSTTPNASFCTPSFTNIVIQLRCSIPSHSLPTSKAVYTNLWLTYSPSLSLQISFFHSLILSFFLTLTHSLSLQSLSNTHSLTHKDILTNHTHHDYVCSAIHQTLILLSFWFLFVVRGHFWSLVIPMWTTTIITTICHY